MVRNRIQQQLSLFLQVIVLYATLAIPYVLIQSAHTIEPPARAHSSIIPSIPASTQQQNDPSVISGKPVLLEIPRLGIKLAIIDGTYDYTSSSWTLSDTMAQFATMTAPISNKPGNTLIYGHNTSAVFEPTAQLQLGDQVVITTDNNHVFTYAYAKDESVVPNDTSVLTASSEKPQLSLLTCEGIWSDKRRIMYFELQKVTA